MLVKLTLSFLFLAVFINAVYSNGAYVVTWDDEAPKAPSRPLLGKKECTYGPDYWCKNIPQASQCHAVKHCIKNVWEKSTYPADNDSVCKVCLDMVKQARDQLLSNETQAELRQVLEVNCKIIPIKVVAEKCIKLIDEFEAELSDVLASRMDPQTVCAVSGLCNSQEIDEMFQSIEDEKNNKFDLSVDSCPKCNFFIGEAISYIKKLSQEEFLHKAFDVCGQLGSYSDGCRGEVFENFETIYQHVQTGLNSKEFCGLVGLCHVETIHIETLDNKPALHRVSLAKSEVSKWTPPLMITDDVGCDFCKQLVTNLRDWFIANQTKEEFIEVVHGLCKQTKSFEKECLKLADEYGAMVYQLLTDTLNPESDCIMIGVCPSSRKNKLFDSKAPITTILGSKTTNTLPGWKLAGDDEKNSINEVLPPMLELVPGQRLTGDDEKEALKPKNDDKPFCEFCELALHEIQNYLQDPATEEKIKQAVDELCDRLPEELKTQCTDFVDNYESQFIAQLVQQMDPSQVCPQMGICNPQLSDLPTCPLCHYAIDKILELIGTNKSKAAIDHAVDKVCYVVPKSMTQKCMKFMQDYGERVAEMIIIDFSTREVCIALHMCFLPQRPVTPLPNRIIIESQLPAELYSPQILGEREIQSLREQYAQKPHVMVDPLKIKDSEKCQICEIVMVQLDNLLKNNSTEEEIKEALEKVCNMLPKKWSAQCDNFVEVYGNMVMQYLAQSMEPHEICLEIGLCDKPKSNQIDSKDDQDYNTSNKCVICEFVITQLHQYIGDNATEAEIKQEVEGICDKLPKSVAKNCRNFVETYGDMIIKYLVDDMDPAQVCTELGLCEQNTIPPFIRDVDRKWDKCQICMIVSEYLSMMLQDHHVDDSIEKVVQKICPAFPSKYRDECKIMIEDYGPYLLSLLAQETDKGQACSMLQLCPENVHNPDGRSKI